MGRIHISNKINFYCQIPGYQDQMSNLFNEPALQFCYIPQVVASRLILTHSLIDCCHMYAMKSRFLLLHQFAILHFRSSL